MSNPKISPTKGLSEEQKEAFVTYSDYQSTSNAAKQLKKELEEKCQKLSDVESKHTTLQEENNVLKRYIDVLEAEKKDLAQNLENFKLQNTELNDCIKQLKAKELESAIFNENLRAKNEANEMELTKKNQNLAELESALKSLKEQYLEIESKNNILEAYNHSLDEKIQKLEKRTAIIIPAEEETETDTGAYDCVIRSSRIKLLLKKSLSPWVIP
jgi:chromosome segregation ATPase